MPGPSGIAQPLKESAGLLGLAEAVDLGADTSGGRARFGKVSAQGRGQEGAENELGATEE